MFNGDSQRNHTKRLLGLTLTLAALTTVTILAWGSVALAQLTTPSWTYTGNLNTGRVFHTATLLPNGKVLVTGGQSGANLDSAELYDPSTGTWSFTGTLNTPRSFFHTATLLPNGKVLVAGGYNGEDINSAELYDPSTGTWSFTGTLNTPRSEHTATLLLNGKVLVAGGGDECGGITDSAELYDPATGTWSITGSLHTARGRHTATLLPDGRVLVAGGTDGFFPSLHDSELYDPNTGTWSVTGDLNTDRVLFTATKLPNGSVLVAGGESHQCSVGGCGFSTVTNSAELYNPAAGTWSYTGNLSYRGYHTATLLPGGQVLVAGGVSFGFGTINSAEIYDPATGNWSSIASLNTPRSFHTATLLSNGKVLVVGGRNEFGGSILPSAELYDSGASSISNQIDDAQFFVRQHYRDFLNREPDAAGLAFWTDNIIKCSDPARRPAVQTEAECIDKQRVTTSAAFFLSPEFQYTGYYVYRLYKGSLIQNGAGRFPTYQEFLRDVQQVASGIIQNNQLSAATIEQNKKTFAVEFTRRAEFRNLYDPLSNFDYVERLFQTTGINVSAQEKQALVVGLNNQTETRASVLQKVVDGSVVIAEGNQQFTTPYGRAFYDKEFNAAFVLMEYFGYLRRDPDAAGYQNWLDKLNFYGNYIDAEMVKSFITSPEYRARFGQP